MKLCNTEYNSNALQNIFFSSLAISADIGKTKFLSRTKLSSVPCNSCFNKDQDSKSIHENRHEKDQFLKAYWILKIIMGRKPDSVGCQTHNSVDI